MNTVSSILARKGNRVISVSPETTVIDALRIMAEKNTGSVVILSHGTFMGIMTERDYSRKVVLKGRNSSVTTVGEIMSTDLPRATPEDSIEHCMEEMTTHAVRYMPVIE